jgi:uncharacterized protein YaaQ
MNTQTAVKFLEVVNGAIMASIERQHAYRVLDDARKVFETAERDETKRIAQVVAFMERAGSRKIPFPLEVRCGTSSCLVTIA